MLIRSIFINKQHNSALFKISATNGEKRHKLLVFPVVTEPRLELARQLAVNSVLAARGSVKPGTTIMVQ